MIVFPVLTWTTLGMLAWPFTRLRNLGVIWRRATLPASLIVIAAHMTKAVEKLATWGGYLPLALRDPAGEGAARGIADGSLASPAALIGMPVVFSVGIVLLITALYLIRREVALEAGAARPKNQERAVEADGCSIPTARSSRPMR